MSIGTPVGATDLPAHRVTVLGGGIVGLIAAASLSTRGLDVAVLARESTARAVGRNGLEIREQSGESWRAPNLFATSDLAELAQRPTDLVVFSVKTFDTEEVLAGWRDAGGSTTRCLSLQNTVHNENLLATVFTETAGAVVRIGGDIVEPGIVAARDGRRVELGSWPEGNAPWLDALAVQLVRGGIGALTRADIAAAKFAKLVLNLDSALTAVANLGVNQVGGPESVQIRRLMRAEALATAEAEDLLIGPLPPIEVTAVPATPAGYSSTWYDLDRRRGRTETRWLNGHIVALGRRHAIPTPANAVLAELAESAASDRSLPGTASPAEILALINERSVA